MEFILTLSDDSKITGPTDDQIRQAIMSLDNAEAFAILSPDNDSNTYIQTSGDVRDGFALEYQVQDIAYHYNTTAPCDAEQVITAFIAYRDGDEHWRDAFLWEVTTL